MLLSKWSCWKESEFREGDDTRTVPRKFLLSRNKSGNENLRALSNELRLHLRADHLCEIRSKAIGGKSVRGVREDREKGQLFLLLWASMKGMVPAKRSEGVISSPFFLLF